MEFWPLSTKPEESEISVGERSESLESGQKARKDLANGIRLSQKFRKCCTNDKTGIPLEEIDPFHKDKGTFVVIGKGTHVIHRFSNTSTSPNKLRRFAIVIITNWLFTCLLIKIIWSNCLASAFQIKLSFFSLEILSLLVSVIEMILKILARGLFHGQFSYLRMWSNYLDIGIVLLGIMSFGTKRVIFNWLTILRIMKLIPLMPGILSAFNFLQGTFKKLLDFLLFSLFPISLFSLLGLQLYMGIFTSKCIHDIDIIMSDLNDTESIEIEIITTFKANAENRSNWYLELGAIDYRLCSNLTEESKCPANYTCLRGYGHNPNFDYTNFDTFFWSAISVIRLMTQDYNHLLYQQMFKVDADIADLFLVWVFFFGTFILGSFAYAIIGKSLIDDFGEENNEPAFQTLDQQNTNAESVGFLKQTCKTILDNQIYEFGVTLILILDIICLFSHNFVHFEVGLAISAVAVIVYATEFLLKLFAESPISYFYKFWNGFDCLVLVMALIYFSIHGMAFLKEEEMTTNVTFYAIRALKLAPRWPSLGFIFRIMFQTIKSFIGIIGLLGIYVFIIALLGYILFSENFKGLAFAETDYPALPRWGFSTFWQSLFSVLRMLGGEWIEIMWDCFRFNGPFYPTVIYFAFNLLAGNLILMTLTLGIVLTTKNTIKAAEQAESRTSHNSSQNQLSVSEIMCLPCSWIADKLSGKLPIATNYTINGAELPTIPQSNSGNEGTTPSQAQVDSGIKIRKFTESKTFKRFSILVIILSSCMLVGTELEIYYFDIFFTVYFIVEIMLRIIGFRISAILKDKGLIFDILLILEMILNFIIYRDFNIGVTCASGACGYLFLRNLRPLMLISRIERLKVVGRGIYVELCALHSYILAGIYLWFVFSILGVQLFAGGFYNCMDKEQNVLLPTNKIECLQDNNTWILADANFKDIFHGFISLLQFASLDSWMPILHNAIDSGEPYGNELNKNPSSIGFFLLYYIFGVLFLFNIFFGVIIDNFPEDRTYSIFRTSAQCKIYEDQVNQEEKCRLIPKPEIKILQGIYNFVTNLKFEIFIMVLILIDCLSLACGTYGFDETYDDMLGVIYIVILFLYLIEFILKIFAWRCHFFRSWLNILDFIVVITSMCGLAFPNGTEKIFLRPPVFRVLRLLRVFRLLKLLRLQKRNFLQRNQIYSLLKAFRLSTPVFINFILFYYLFLISYMILGFELFNTVKFSNGEGSEDLGRSFLTLLEISTFGGWAHILQNIASAGHQDCDDPLDNCPKDVHSFATGSVFIFTFLGVTIFIVANLYFIFILEIINQFKTVENLTKNQECIVGKRTENIEIGEIPKVDGKIDEEEIHVDPTE